MPFRPLLRTLSAVLIVSLLNMGMLQTAGAAAIDTQAAIALEDRAAVNARIDERLAREDVRQAMQSLGVDPDQARERVAALTDAEVLQLDGKLAQLPAAGDGGWFLLVIVLGVLIFLFASGKLNYR
ncbi:MAG: PA2779 family protein [Burkholderiales bacterium]|nr:PA2779 family protein [Burkholderiales bacterium]